MSSDHPRTGEEINRMREVAIIGVGSTVMGKFPEMLPYELGAKAARAAIEDAGISPRDLQQIDIPDIIKTPKYATIVFLINR